MCGIVGFTGNSQAAPVLLDGLSKYPPNNPVTTANVEYVLK